MKKRYNGNGQEAVWIAVSAVVLILCGAWAFTQEDFLQSSILLISAAIISVFGFVTSRRYKKEFADFVKMI